jgi:serine O-acetyltransferase
MSLRDTLETLRADLARHWDRDAGKATNVWWLAQTQGVWATVVLRLGQLVYERPHPLVGPPAKLAYQLLQKAVEVTTGIQVPASTRIGRGFYIGHFGAIIVHPATVMGENCSIGQGVTIGTKGRGNDGVPAFGDDVYIGAGAKVLGGIQVGDGASIGANAVVVRDVPAGAVAVGVPAKIVPR